jgi:MFS family permease
VVALLLGLTDLQKPLGVGLIGLAAVLFIVLLWVERRAADPVLPLPLFKDRLFAVAVSQGLLAGWAMFGSTSFIPLFAQAVLGTSATAAGSVLTPMMLGWVGASIIGSRLLLRFGYRTIALAGMVTLVAGTFFMTRISPQTTLPRLMVNVALMGIGMGLSIPAFMIAVQSSVQRKVMGTATATVQFSRSIGGTLGVSVMGVILSVQLSANLRAAGAAAAGFSLDTLLRPVGGAAPAVNIVLREALTAALQSVFVAALIAAVAGLVVTALAPRGNIFRATQVPEAIEADASAAH